MKKIMIAASAVLLLLAVAPLSVRAEDDDKGKNDIASACKTIIRLVKVYPQFNLTVPPACKAWEDGAVKKQCTELKANLRVGDRGERVRVLHQMLVQAGYGPFANEEFDEQTAAAVVGFQEQYRADVLAPYSLVRGTGYVGVSTRAKLNALFGCVVTIPPSQTVSLRIISAPSTLKVNETGTWKLGITTASSSDYTVAVTWGDEAVPTTGTAASVAEKSVANTTTFTHSYAATGSYWVTFRLTSGGQSRTVTRRVEVKTGNITEQKITVISPNGGEVWDKEETRTISWKAEKAGKVTLWLDRNFPCSPGQMCLTVYYPRVLIAKNVSSKVGVNNYTWKISEIYDDNSHNYGLSGDGAAYNINICTDSSEASKNCYQGDSPFKITVNPTRQDITVISPNGGESWNVGETRKVTWNATNKSKVVLWLIPENSCIADGSTVCPASARAPIQISEELYSYPGDNTFNWLIHRVYNYSNYDVQNGTYYGIWNGKYYLRICPVAKNVCDMSDSTFTLTSKYQDGALAPVIQGVSGPSSLSVGEEGTWKFSAYDPKAGYLSYSVLWGDENATTMNASLSSPTPLRARQETSFTHRYAVAGTYTVRVVITDSLGKTAESSLSVVVR